MTRDIPRTKRISEVKRVDDLLDGERAVSDSDLVWRCKMGKKLVPDFVALSVERQGDDVYARSLSGEVLHVMGDDATFTLTAGSRRRAKGSPKSTMVPKPRGF